VGDWSDVHDFFHGLTKVRISCPADVRYPEGFTQSFAAVKKLGLAGSFSFFSLDTKPAPRCVDGARINTAGTAATGRSDGAGAREPGHRGIWTASSASKFFGQRMPVRRGSAVAMLDLNFTDSAQARIGRGAIVKPTSWPSTANSDTNNISIAEAGANRARAPPSTPPCAHRHPQHHLAQIDRGAVISAKGDVDVRATDSTLNINIAGGISKGTSAVASQSGHQHHQKYAAAWGIPARRRFRHPGAGRLERDAQGSFTLPAQIRSSPAGRAVQERDGRRGGWALTDGKLYYVIVPDPTGAQRHPPGDSSGNALGASRSRRFSTLRRAAAWRARARRGGRPCRGRGDQSRIADFRGDCGLARQR